MSALSRRRFGLGLAIDAFPYLVAAGPGIAARHVADAAGLLEAGGALAIFNYSYRGDLDADRADITQLAAFMVSRRTQWHPQFYALGRDTFLLRRS